MGCVGSKHNQVAPSSIPNNDGLPTSEPLPVQAEESHQDSNSNTPLSQEPQPAPTKSSYPKPVAFNVPSSDTYSSDQSQLKFQRLKPLGSQKVTQESLEQEQQQAQERKSKLINQRNSKANKLRTEIRAARNQNDIDKFNEVERKIEDHYNDQLSAETKTNQSGGGGGSIYEDDVMEGDATFNVDDNDDWKSESNFN